MILTHFPRLTQPASLAFGRAVLYCFLVCGFALYERKPQTKDRQVLCRRRQNPVV